MQAWRLPPNGDPMALVRLFMAARRAPSTRSAVSSCIPAAHPRGPMAVQVPQRPQHPDARMHHEVATFGGTDQATDGGLPFLGILLGHRQFHDVVGGIAQSQPLAPTRGRIGSSKRRAPAAAGFDGAIS